jgi:lipopolysaccharide transport system ATP-binding protein
MSQTVISVENLAKSYQLGVIGTGTFFGDVNRWWAKRRGRPDPFLKVGMADHGNRDRETIWALKDLNFSVQQGEALGIIGRNGAGKSTLLKILSQVTSPTSGEVKVKGRIASLLEVGTGFHPELTGRENIYLNGAIMGMNRDEVNRKFDEIVDFSGVEKFIDTPVKRYSSGMYVRLAFAVAAHLEPEILVVDEVLAVGDAEFQKKCLGKMNEVASTGSTVLFVSHNMSAIRRFCSRSIWIEKGITKEIGPTEEITENYLSSSLSDSTPVIELPDMPMGNIYGKGSRLTLMDSQGQYATQIHIGEKWTVVLDFEMKEARKKVIAGIGILLEGNGLVTYWSQPKDLDIGLYRVEFECDIRLQSCDLQFSVGLSEREQAFYYVQDVGRLTISEISDGEQLFVNKGAGILLGDNSAVIQKTG